MYTNNFNSWPLLVEADFVVIKEFSTKSMETYKEHKNNGKRERLYWLYSVL